MPDLGRAALVVRSCCSCTRSCAGAFAAWNGRRRLAESAQNALIASFGATAVAPRSCSPALVRHDFSFPYVADHTSRELPLGYTLTAFWGGQEGSLLLWLLVLCGYSAAAVLTGRRAGRDVLAWVVPVLGARRQLLRASARLRREPVRDAARRRRRRRPQPEPAEPVHGDPPADALPRLRRAHGPVRVRDGRAARAAAPTSAGSSRRGAGRSPPGRSSASASCSARTGRTSRSAGAATTRGTRSRTRR